MGKFNAQQVLNRDPKYSQKSNKTYVLLIACRTLTSVIAYLHNLHLLANLSGTRLGHIVVVGVMH
jgi:hypothetical protein